jgi:type II secretory pathway component GspD/PulD (secretin)
VKVKPDPAACSSSGSIRGPLVKSDGSADKQDSCLQADTAHPTAPAVPERSGRSPRDRASGTAGVRRFAVARVAWGLLALWTVAQVHAQPLVLEIHALKYRTVEQVLPVVAPLVPPPGTVGGLQNQLVVRATAQTQADIRAVLDRLDAPPRRLLISVRHDDQSHSRETATAAQGQVVLGQTRGVGVDLRLQDGRSSAAGQGIQQIQVLEGQPALIRSGQSSPVPMRQTVRGPDGSIRVIETVDYRETGSSLQVLPRLAGEQVILDILPERGEPGPGGSVSVQRLATQVSGRLGEWIELGGVTQDSSVRQSTLLGSTSRAGREARRTWVRVEEIR